MAMTHTFSHFRGNFDRKDLIAKLTANREKHIKIYHEALKEYRKRTLENLKAFQTEVAQRIQDIEAGEVGSRDFWDDMSPDSLRHPVSFRKVYDRALAMLGMVVDEKINLEGNQFRAWVLDEWDWTSSFSTTNAVYANSYFEEEEDEDDDY